ncbi:MAG: hypothetical protein Q8O67_24090 [Deltaproteobacteria bacterium]|nr:hypothetical protein [Deltaproteobacteria bacterium]
MSPLLIALLGVMLVPLFVATWRASLLGLACQGLLMAWIASRMHPELDVTSDWHSLVATALTLIDLGVVRGVIAPFAFFTVMRARGPSTRNDVLPPTLLSWSLALASVLVAWTVSETLLADDGEQQTLAFVATSGLLLGFLELSTQSSPFSQVIGLMRIENSVALFELRGDGEHGPLAVQVGLVVVVVVTIALCRWYLRNLDEPADPVVDVEGETL